MGSVDKDFRFMATNDLMTELQKGSIKLDDDSEKKVVAGVLKLVEDKNGEVQNLAVKWCGSSLLLAHTHSDPHIYTHKHIYNTFRFTYPTPPPHTIRLTHTQFYSDIYNPTHMCG